MGTGTRAAGGGVQQVAAAAAGGLQLAALATARFALSDSRFTRCAPSWAIAGICQTRGVDQSPSRLGTTPAVLSLAGWEKVGWFRSRIVTRDVGYLDWTIDGVPLREVLAWPNGTVAEEVTPLHNDRASAEYRLDYLRALLSEPVRSKQAVMPDGRVPILVCPVDFDLGCRALTAEIAFSENTVEWRDIAWQANFEPLELAEQELAPVSVTFDRAQYEGLVRALLVAETD